MTYPTLFNEKRAAQAAAFLLHRAGGRLPVLKLMKLMYLAERESLRLYGEPIIGDPGEAGLGTLTAGAVELSNSDIGQNLIASIIFYEWGFGVADMIAGQWYTYWTLLIYLGIAALLVAFSALWLRRFIIAVGGVLTLYYFGKTL